jgi:hypothetical protein
MQWKWKACCGKGAQSVHRLGEDLVTGRAYVANAPSYRALLARGGSLVSLALDAEVHNMVSADCATIDDDIPCPKCHSVPLEKRSLSNCVQLWGLI